MTVAGHRLALGDALVVGSTALLAIAVLLSASVLPWFQLVALNTVVADAGAGLFGVLALLFALLTLAAAAAIRQLGDRLPALPFKRTSVPFVFATFSLMLVLLAAFTGRDVGGTAYENAFGLQVALVSAIALWGGTVLNLITDPAPLVT